MKRFLKALPIIAVTIIAIYLIIANKDLSINELISYTPKNKAFAALFLLFLYALKSFTIVIPIDMLCIAGGVLFSELLGSVINITGVLISIFISYFIGKFSGSELNYKLIKKYPKLKKIREKEKNNEFFFSFIMRALGILPCDIVGMYMGGAGISLKNYMIGGILGFAPSIILVTILGSKLDEPKSWAFCFLILFNLIFSAISTAIYKIIKKWKEKK